MTAPLRVVVVISGRGSNLIALHQHARPETYQIVGVISSRADAAGLAYARAQGLTTQVIEASAHGQRTAYEAALAAGIDAYAPDVIALAGFMRILTPDFVTRYAGRLINIHPSLLPAFPGLDTHRRALEAGVREHGATVHYVTPVVDGGPIIDQMRLTVDPGESPEQLAARVLALEHQLYPAVLTRLAKSRRHAPL
ncbi:MAG: phosphoribosylglycinamide formyltransferase [Gammaproteobacteria bacterium]|nr:phosphoribosylglycinamide formyltransferase [Gammaproteobacteria bacterium]